MSDRKEMPLTFVLANTTPRRQCGTFEELFDWLRRAEFRAVGLDAEAAEFGYIISAGAPGPDYAHLPWLDISADPAVWRVRRGGKWTPVDTRHKGELVTRARVAATVAADIPDGWSLADGTDPFGIDLTAIAGFFVGSDPNWDVYTMVFVGYGGI